MANKWTTEQEQAISLRNRNLLVSAAAGSGKTAVLVERIVRLLLNKENPMNVENLLVVTFTEAAAAEMKERVRVAIEGHLEKEPDNEHLQTQSVLIVHGNISTIHGFCLEVIRNYFHEVDIEPGFRIGEQGELKLIRQDVLEELLEKRYASPDNQDLLDFVEKFGGGRNDKGIEGKILKLYDYSMSTPHPETWLESSIRNYTENVTQMEEIGFSSLLTTQVNQYLEDGIEYMKEGMQMSMAGDGPHMYLPMLESDLEFLERVKALQTFEERRKAIHHYNPMRLSSKKDEGVSIEKREGVKEIRGKVKDKIITKLQKEFFLESETETLGELASCGKTASVLIDLVKEFATSFAKAKGSLNILDFNDMEHLALNILTTEKEGKLEPSAVAREYQNKFHEIMIDEYQDSNLIQESILTTVSRCGEGKNNIFMVGDIKQSIYRFRLSVPELFMEKYDTYTQEESAKQRVILHKNFRSRPQVLASVNEIFQGIMRKEVGGITYDDKVALYPGATFEELCLIHPSESRDALESSEGGRDGSDTTKFENIAERESSVTKSTYDTELLVCGELEEGEASLIKTRIKELIETGQVIDEETKQFRKVKYKDIVILLRSIKGHGEKLATYLTDNGIPVYFGSQEGYFDAYEVSVLLDYLRVINNARQDIPLTAVLTSPFVGLTTGELAKIKKAFPEVPFYQGVWEYRKGQEMLSSAKTHDLNNQELLGDALSVGEDEVLEGGEVRDKQLARDKSLTKKLQKFWQEIHDYREMLPYLGIHDLLWRIIEETGYGLSIQGMVSGNQRKANLDMLIEKAAAFEGTSYKGVFHFIRYIEELKKYEVEFGEASIADEQSDVVRIMSIHKSKGLEFPVVILAGMSKMFNTQDLKSDVLIHPFLGIGLNAVDLERRTVSPTLLKNVIKNQLMVENLGEELRVLYVAMTRAKEKLIMTAKLKEKDFLALQEKLEKTDERSFSISENNKLSFFEIISASSYTDWVLPMVLKEGFQAPLRLKLYFSDEIEEGERVEALKEGLTLELLRHWDKEQVFDQKLREQFLEQLNYHYPYEKVDGMKLKFTVSELKKREVLREEFSEPIIEETPVIPLFPNFLNKLEEALEQPKSSGATRGNAYHLFLENLDFGKEYSLSDLKHLKKRLVEEDKLEAEDATLIDSQSIMKFLETELVNRMKRAKQNNALVEEQPFVMTACASEVYPGEIEPDKERVLIQGIVDLWFEEEGELVIVDYKTDRVKGATELMNRYATQLEFYGKALEQLTGKKVKEKLIYSFWLQEEIEMNEVKVWQECQ